MTTTLDDQIIQPSELKHGLVLMRWNAYLRMPNEFAGYEPVIIEGTFNGYVTFYPLTDLRIVDWQRVKWEPVRMLVLPFLSRDETTYTKHPNTPEDQKKVKLLWEHIYRRREELRSQFNSMDTLFNYLR
jgi:hypothetical protein